MMKQKVRPKNNKRLYIFFALFVTIAWIFYYHYVVRHYVDAGIVKIMGKATVTERVEEYGQEVAERLAGAFADAGVDWPAKKITFIGLKEEKQLEVWIADDDGQYHFLKSYPILAASGHAGPKLKEGDRQVPEGIYAIESLNPNSRYHLSLRINYPNTFDKQMAANEGRTNLGSDIMIHGSNGSVGCLAMGDRAAEDLFIMAAKAGVENITVILSPTDLRKQDYKVDLTKLPDWIPRLYEQIKTELMKYSRDSK